MAGAARLTIVRAFGMISATALLASCMSEGTTTQRSVNTVQRGDGICSPYSISNARTLQAGFEYGVGFDLCTDGRVFNWDGNYRGTFSQEGGQVTINWNDAGPVWHHRVGTYNAELVNCRASGRLSDCTKASST